MSNTGKRVVEFGWFTRPFLSELSDPDVLFDGSNIYGLTELKR